MCLIIFKYKTHPDYKLILAGNRDEFYERQAIEAHWWKNHQEVLGGIDVVSGGTWLGITKSGRFITITNYRSPKDMTQHGKCSRGEMARCFLTQDITVYGFGESVRKNQDKYNGFNLIYGHVDKLSYFSNRGGEPALLRDGLHGLSNHLLDTDWPKVGLGKRLFTDITDQPFQPEDLIEMMYDESRPNDDRLPETGVSLEKERMLSSMFIKSPDYGTRCSTALLVTHDNKVTFLERTYDRGNEKDVKYTFDIK